MISLHFIYLDRIYAFLQLFLVAPSTSILQPRPRSKLCLHHYPFTRMYSHWLIEPETHLSLKVAITIRYTLLIHTMTVDNFLKQFPALQWRESNAILLVMENFKLYESEQKTFKIKTTRKRFATLNFPIPFKNKIKM